MVLSMPVINEDKLKQVTAAIEKAGGDPIKAALFMGITCQELNQYLKGHPELADRCKKRDPVPPMAETTLHRPSTITNDVALAEAIVQEDELFKDSLVNIGRTPEHAEKALALQQLTNRHFKNTVELMHGGVVQNFLDCLVEKDNRAGRLTKLTEALNDTETYPYGSEIRAQMVSEEAALAKQMRELGDEVLQTNKVVYQGAMVLSIMRQQKKQKGPKLGFKVQGAVNVEDVSSEQ